MPSNLKPFLRFYRVRAAASSKTKQRCRTARTFISVYKDTYDGDLHPPHPGEILREDILPLLSLTRRQFARHLGVSVRVLSELLSERRSVTLDIAQRLGAALGQGARYWLGLQMQHDVWLTTQGQNIAVKPLSWGKTRPAAHIRLLLDRLVPDNAGRRREVPHETAFSIELD